MGAIEITLIIILGLCLIVGGAYIWATSYHPSDIKGILIWDPSQGLIGILCVVGGLVVILSAIASLFKKKPAHIKNKE